MDFARSVDDIHLSPGRIICTQIPLVSHALSMLVDMNVVRAALFRYRVSVVCCATSIRVMAYNPLCKRQEIVYKGIDPRQLEIAFDGSQLTVLVEERLLDTTGAFDGIAPGCRDSLGEQQIFRW